MLSLMVRDTILFLLRFVSLKQKITRIFLSLLHFALDIINAPLAIGKYKLSMSSLNLFILFCSSSDSEVLCSKE